MNNVYLVVERDETGKTRETRVLHKRLPDYIRYLFEVAGVELLAVIRLPERK